MNINDSNDWTVAILWLFIGLMMTISMSILFWSCMRSFYKEKFAQKQNLSLLYNSEISSMVMSRLISFFCIPFGVWLTLIPLIAIVDSDLSQGRVFALANTMTIVISVPMIILVWIVGYQGAKVFVLEFKMKQTT